MNKLILPNTYIEKIDDPLIYLAGPIMSAPDWQKEAIKILFSKEEDLTVVSPRLGDLTPFTPCIQRGDENRFKGQREWEWHYMDLAAKKGCLLFWLPREESHHCIKPYGEVTRLELGQWMTRYKFDNSLNMCFGGNWRFPGIHLISYDLELHIPDVTVYETLSDTCDEALSICYLDA